METKRKISLRPTYESELCSSTLKQTVEKKTMNARKPQKKSKLSKKKFLRLLPEKKSPKCALLFILCRTNVPKHSMGQTLAN